MSTPTIPLRRAGASGLYLSAIGLGLGRWGASVDDAAGQRLLNRALELGVTHWDTASGYGGGESERIVGRFFAAAGPDVRDRVILSTKWAGTHGNGRGGIRKAVDGCLRRLQTDYLDIFMLHNPGMDADGRYLAPLDETWGALADLVTQGKVHYLGLSNAHGSNVRDAAAALARVSDVRLTLVENNYSLLQRGQVGRGLWTDWLHGGTEPAFLRDLETLGIGLIPYWPLSMGALTGRYRAANAAEVTVDDTFRAQFLTGPTLQAIEALADYAATKGVPMAHLAIAWLLANPRVAGVICGTTSLPQLEENAAAAALTLTPAKVADLDAIAATAETVDAFCARYFR